MSRTVHHIRSKRAPSRGCWGRERDGWRPGEPIFSLAVHDLRHSARCRAEAAAHGHRPRPEARVHRAGIRRWARYQRDPLVAR
ncbi:hypothetical protein LG632_25330, partial [Streptomyces sp. SMC 277]|nr:hypothetical protein [Streptomyces antimicrobicus]